MILLSPNQDLTAASGLIDIGLLNDIYHSFMDEALSDMGREVMIHLEPSIESDSITNSQPQSMQYNPFFKRAAIPSPNTRNTGVKITTRDVLYKGHVRIGPFEGNDNTGMGSLKENEARITLVIEALEHVKSARSIGIEGRRYSVSRDRPIGFTERKYIMVWLTEIQESDIQEGMGTNG